MAIEDADYRQHRVLLLVRKLFLLNCFICAYSPLSDRTVVVVKESFMPHCTLFKEFLVHEIEIV